MSGIYIKGMEMPTSCRECGIEQEGFWCGALDGYQNTQCCANERREDCPLIAVPDHGRLGDLDKLAEKIHDCWDAYPADAFCEDFLDEMPTIIPASVKEKT